MTFFCIDQQSSELFVGSHEPFSHLTHRVSLSRCVLVPEGVDATTAIPSTYEMKAGQWAFVEDSFDPVSRVRRGRLWSPCLSVQPDSREVAPSLELRVAWQATSARVKRPLLMFQPATELVRGRPGGVGAVIAIGDQQAFTLWRVLYAEKAHDGALTVTLKSRSALGALPELSLSSVKPEFHDTLRTHYSIALEAVHREAPGSVVDRIKDTMAVMVSRWLVQNGHADESVFKHDIGKLVAKLAQLTPRPYCLTALGDVLAKLHARNKPNVQYELGARTVLDSDAELAIQALAFTMHDLGLAAAGT